MLWKQENNSSVSSNDCVKKKERRRGDSPSRGRYIWRLIEDRFLYIIPNLSHDGKAVREIEK